MYQHFISTSKFKINICIANFSCPCYLSSQVATRSALAFSFYLPFSSTTFSHGSLGGGLIISRNAYFLQSSSSSSSAAAVLSSSSLSSGTFQSLPFNDHNNSNHQTGKETQMHLGLPSFLLLSSGQYHSHFLFGTEFFLFKFEI